MAAGPSSDDRESLTRDLTQLRQFLLSDGECDASTEQFNEDSSYSCLSSSVWRNSDVFSTRTISSCGSVYPAENIRLLRSCLDLNLNLQANTRDNINLVRHMKQSIDNEIEEQMKRIEDEMGRRKETAGENKRPEPVVKRLGPLTKTCFRRPYFRNVYGLNTELNEDMVEKARNGEILPINSAFSSGWRWSDQTLRDELLNQVRRGCLAVAVQPLIKERDDLKDVLKEIDGPAAECAEKELANVQQEIRNAIKNTDCENLMRDPSVIARVDWMRVSKRISGNITGTTCRFVWNNYFSPLINKKPFKKTEDQLLLSVATSFNMKNWQAIAEQLGTRRSPFQCIQRFQSKLVLKVDANEISQEKYESSHWTDEAKTKLVKVIEAMKPKKPYTCECLKYIDWLFVSQNVGNGKLPSQCCEKFVELMVKVNEGSWSQNEDKLLKSAVETIGVSNWVSVSARVQTRSPTQCRRRWNIIRRKKISDEMSYQPILEWSAEEDATLWFARHSKQKRTRAVPFTKIDTCLLPHRMRPEITERFKQLTTWHRQAKWLLQNEGTLLSLIVKSDADLTLCEVNTLKNEIVRLQKIRRCPSALSATSSDDTLSSIGSTAQDQLERMAQTMVLEASLSRDLVKDKVKLIRDIVNFDATPVPLLRNIPEREIFLNSRAEAFGKIKDHLIQIKKSKLAQKNKTSSVSFGKIMSQLRVAMDDSATADEARALLLELESVTGGTRVKSLIKISQQLESLSRKAKPPASASTLKKNPTKSEWAEYFYKFRPILTNEFLGKKKITPLVESSERAMKTAHSFPLAKLMISKLGANVSRLTNEVVTEKEMNEECDEDDDLSPSLLHDDLKLAKFFTAQANRVLQENCSHLADDLTVQLNFTDEDVNGANSGPSIPPNFATVNAFRLLTKSFKQTLEIMVSTADNGNNGLDLQKKVADLKSNPTDAYQLLRRRFFSLFAWPSVLSQQSFSEEDKLTKLEKLPVPNKKRKSKKIDPSTVKIDSKRSRSDETPATSKTASIEIPTVNQIPQCSFVQVTPEDLMRLLTESISTFAKSLPNQPLPPGQP